MTLLRRFWPVLFLGLVALVPLWRPILLGEAIGPHDQIAQMQPWAVDSEKALAPWDVLQADGVLQFYPWRDLVFEAWRQGEPPYWNPYQLAGTPLLANSQSAGFYPPHILVGLTGVSTAAGMTLLAWAHLFWAGLGVFILCLRLGAGRFGAALGASGFALSSFILAWTALPSVISTCAWIPWILAGVFGLFGFGVERRWPQAVLLAFSTGMMLLAGHLQFSAYGLMAAVLIALILAIVCFKDGGLKAGFACAAAVAVGACLSAPQLLPVLEYSKFSHRQNVASEEGYAAYVGGALKPFELAQLAHPTILGNPRHRADKEDSGLSSYWPSLVKPGANLAESALGLGPILLGLMLLAPWKQRGVGALAALAVVALLIAMGTGLTRLMYFGVPGWSSTGSPARIVVLFVLGACVLAGLGADRLLKTEAKKPLLFLAPLIAALLPLAFLTLAPAAGPRVAQVFEGMVGQAFSQALPSLLIGLVLAVVMVAVCTHADYRNRFKPVLLAFPLLFAWMGFGSDLVTSGKPLQPFEAPGAERVAFVNSNWNLFQRPNAVGPPNTASLSRVRDLAGYDSLLHRDTVAMLRDVDGEDPAPPENGNMMFVKPGANLEKLEDAGVTQLWSLQPMQALGEPVRSGAFYVYDLIGRGRAYTPAGPARFESETLNMVLLRAEGPGRLILKDRMMPGWQAFIGEREIPVSGSLWREVELPEGEHLVQFRYTPPGLRTGLFLGLPAWLLLLIGAGVILGRRGSG